MNNINVPKGSWLDQNGKRWVKVIFDVMSDGGKHFVRQVTVTLGLHFDFAIGGYVFDVEFGEELAQEIFRQYPSLASIRNINMLPTTNKIR